MDRVTETLLAALKKAMLDPGNEHRLFRSGKLDGLFASKSGVTSEAASRAIRDGLLEIVRAETKGKTTFEWVRLLPRGIDFIHEQESPVHALHELREVLRVNQRAIPAWLDEMRTSLAADAQKWTQRLEGLTRSVEAALKRIEEATPLMPAELTTARPWVVDAVNYLDRRLTGGAPGDCPLPELFKALARQHDGLSIPAFHDGLKRLRERRVVRLSPAPEPADLVQPEFALLSDGELLYLAGR